MATEASDNVLIGTGERLVKLGFVEIHVYSLEMYVHASDCRSILKKYQGLDTNGLIRSPTFYADLVNGNFTKTFRLTFCRTLSQAKLVGGFDEPLKMRCSENPQEDANVLLSKLVPPQGVVTDDVLSLVCHGDGETLTGLYESSQGGEQQELVQISSGGEGGAWQALQNIYFDENTQLPTIRVSAISQLPNVLLPPTNTQESSMMVSQEDIELAVEQDLAGGKTKKTWSEFAGRTSGGDGYKFGDLTLGVVTAIGLRNKPPESIGRGELSLGGSKSATKSIAANAKPTISTLQQDVRQIGEEVSKLRTEMKGLCLPQQESETVQESNLEFLFRLAAASALVEASYILLHSVADVDISSLQKFQLYVVLALILGSFKYALEQRHDKTKRKQE